MSLKDDFKDEPFTAAPAVTQAPANSQPIRAALEAVRDYMAYDDPAWSEPIDPEWAALVRKVRAALAVRDTAATLDFFAIREAMPRGDGRWESSCDAAVTALQKVLGGGVAAPPTPQPTWQPEIDSVWEELHPRMNGRKVRVVGVWGTKIGVRNVETKRLAYNHVATFRSRFRPAPPLAGAQPQEPTQ